MMRSYSLSIKLQIVETAYEENSPHSAPIHLVLDTQLLCLYISHTILQDVDTQINLCLGEVIIKHFMEEAEYKQKERQSIFLH